jgi:hypothetical protein
MLWEEAKIVGHKTTGCRKIAQTQHLRKVGVLMPKDSFAPSGEAEVGLSVLIAEALSYAMAALVRLASCVWVPQDLCR